MLRTQSPENYDKWVSNELKFDSPEVVAAIDTFGSFAKNDAYVDGGAAGVASTVTRLLSAELQDTSWARSVATLAPAPAHVCLYLGLRGDIRQAGASPANKWFYERWSSEDEAWQIDGPDPLPPAPVLYCSFPSLKDPTHDPGPEQASSALPAEIQAQLT